MTVSPPFRIVGCVVIRQRLEGLVGRDVTAVLILGRALGLRLGMTLLSLNWATRARTLSLRTRWIVVGPPFLAIPQVFLVALTGVLAWTAFSARSRQVLLW